MLKVQNPVIYSNFDKNLLPEVFIDSIDIENSKILVHFHVKDNQHADRSMPRWLKNEFILENLYVYVGCNGSNQFQTLNSLKKNSVIKNYTLYGAYTFPFSGEKDVSLLAFTSNKEKNITGKRTYEPILEKGEIPVSLYNSTQFDYFSKVKDLRLFSFKEKIFNKQYVFDVEKYITNFESSKELFISYSSKKKQANIAYVFNLEHFLIQNSHSYRFLSQFKSFKNLILLNSSINNKDGAFYKKEEGKNKQYTKINSIPSVLKLNADPLDKKYLITISDEEAASSDYKKYLIKISWEVVDYSNILIKQEIYDGLQKAKGFIINYKQKIESIFASSEIIEPRTYFFENEYEKNIDQIIETITLLSNLYSVYSETESVKYQALFLNIFHPLTTRVELLEYLLTNISKLERNYKNLINQINSLGIPGASFITENNNKFEIEFNKNFFGRENNYINYNFDSSSGIDVFEPNEMNYEFQMLENVDMESRKKQEILKYFGTEDAKPTEDLNHLSAKYIHLGNTSYNFSRIDTQKKLLKTYSGREVSFDIPMNNIRNMTNKNNTAFFEYENLFFQLADNGIYIKSVSKKKNNSPYSKLNYGILFDNNPDSQDKSKKYFEEININDMYFLVDDSMMLPIPEDLNILQREASTGGTISSVYPLTEQIINDPTQKLLIIAYYNFFYALKEAVVGTQYSLYEVEESLVNEIFLKKLKLYNKYFIVKRYPKIIPESGGFASIDRSILSEISSNVFSYNLNRDIQEPQATLDLSDL